MGEIGTAIQGAIGYLTEHPDEAAYTDSAATARLRGGPARRHDRPRR